MSLLPAKARKPAAEQSAEPLGNGQLPKRMVAQHRRRVTNRTLLWIAALLLLGAFVGAMLGYLTRPHVASIQLIASERAFATATEAADFAAMANSREILWKAAPNLNQPLTLVQLQERSQVAVEGATNIIVVTGTGGSRSEAEAIAVAVATSTGEAAMEWATRRGREMEGQIGALQQRMRNLRSEFSYFDEALLATDVRGVRESLAREVSDRRAAVAGIEQQIATVNTEEKKTMAALAVERPVVKSLQQELEQALTKYTEAHPRVKELRAAMAALQKEAPGPDSAAPSAKSNAQLAELNSKRASLLDQLKAAEANEVSSRNALQRFATNEVEFVRMQSEYNALSTRRDELVQALVLVSNRALVHWRKADRVEHGRLFTAAGMTGSSVAGAAFGLLAAALSVPILRRRSRNIQTEQALQIATGLPVLSVLQPLNEMTAAQIEYWGVETLNRLRNAAGVRRRGCFVCGVISGNPGEGRSTFIDLLSEAGMKNGNRVLVISRPGLASNSAGAQESAPQSAAEAAVPPGSALVARNESGSRALARYEFPDRIDHIDFQRYWERALTDWQEEDNAVILIELPPAESADALLLAAAVPNVVWLSEAGVSDAEKTSAKVDSLRNSGSYLIGSALNMKRQPSRAEFLNRAQTVKKL